MHSESRNNTNILKQACKNKPNKVLIGLNIYKKKVKSDIDLNSKKYLNLPHINGLDSNLIKEEGLNKTFDGSSGTWHFERTYRQNHSKDHKLDQSRA